MDLAAVRRVVNENPEGVIIRMIDGTEYRLPHRDYITLGPPPEERSRRSPHATSFHVWSREESVAHLVNALLVKEIVPLGGNGNGRSHKKRSKRGK